jgi:hypothetical protein
MTSIDTLSGHVGSVEKESQVTSKIESLEPMEENSLNLDEAIPLEVQDDFSRVVTFELGSNVNDEGVVVETIDPGNPYAVILDVWTADDKVFVLPRSVDRNKPEDISNKAWDLTDWPMGLPVGRQRNDIWEEKTGEALPGEVSGKHFVVSVKDGVLHFVDIGSTNGTRMETATLTEEAEQNDMAQTLPRKRALAVAAENLMADPEAGNNHLRAETSQENPDTSAAQPFKEREQEYDPRATDRQLQDMQNRAIGWETMLGSQPTFTYSDQLYEISASLTTELTALHDLRESMKTETDSPIGRTLSEAEATASEAQASASVVASNVESQVYASGAEAHNARRRVEDLLRRYSDNLSEVRRLINE